ncbi:unnamed protein product [Hyaloperonospora brassicae]|uniref:RxLR effector candidate protein n=1 Tax=Hyaloperonospora brassicae TaxID=162125 RepID=A0AAV0UJT7_HYABA|nr:unnamed protein product [Hyaloperonospora brassicae]
MGFYRFLLLHSAAMLMCAYSSSGISNGTKAAETDYPVQSRSFVEDKNGARVHPLPIARDASAGEERAFTGPTALIENALRSLLLKTMGVKNRFMETIASFMSRLHFKYWERKGHTPSDLARSMKLFEGENLFAGQKLKLLERYIDFFCHQRNTEIKLVDVLVQGFGGEAKFAPFLYAFASRNPGNAKADELLDVLFAKWQGGKERFEDVFARLKIKEAGFEHLSYKQIMRLHHYREQYILDTRAKDVKTLGSLLGTEFDSEGKLAVRAVDKLEDDDTKVTGKQILLELFGEWKSKLMTKPEVRSKMFSGMEDVPEELIERILRDYKTFSSDKWVAK